MARADVCRSLAVLVALHFISMTPAGAAWTYFGQLPGGAAVVVDDMPGDAALYAHEEAGEHLQVPIYTEEQAARLAVFLAIQSKSQYIPDVLTGQRALGEKGDLFDEEGSYFLCLYVAGLNEPLGLEVPGEKRFAIRDEDHQRLLLFTLAQAKYLMPRLLDAGLNVAQAAAVIAGFRVNKDPNESSDFKVITPGCGECASGQVCNAGGLRRCCTGGGGACQACVVCDSYMDFSLKFDR